MYRYLTAALIWSLCISSAYAGPPANWPFKPWNEAVAAAKADGKLLFILFGYEDCPWCDTLYRRAMNDDEVRSRYSAALMLTYVDTKATPEDKEHLMPDGSTLKLKELLKRYRVYPVPFWLYVSETGTVLNSDRGGKTTSRELLRDLDVALSKRAPAAASDGTGNR